MKQLVFFTLLFTAFNIAHGQFTQPPTTTSLNLGSRPDSITITTAPKLNMQVYNEAYEQYLRQVQFKQRNKMIIKGTGLTLTQAAFDNWTAGGNNSLSARAFAHVEHHYTGPNFNIKSIFEGAVSVISSDGKFNKSEDYWNINIKPNWRIAPKWEASGDLLIKSQFANTLQYNDDQATIVSGFMAPGEIIASAGITYVPPKGRLSIYIAPVSGNLFMVLSEELAAKGSFGMDPGQKFKPKFGALFRVIYNEKFAKDKIEYYTKLESFWNYDSDPTIWWENKLNFKFTNLFGANIYFLAKYNKNEAPPRVKEGGSSFWDYCQINESFGLGLSFNFQSKVPTKIETPYVKVKKRRR